MQIGIAGYCVMLFFDFILRFREEVRPFMPILRVFIGECRIFLAVDFFSRAGTRVPDSATRSSGLENEGTDYKLLSSVCFLLFPNTPPFPALEILEDYPGGDTESARAPAAAYDATNTYS